ncbi:hypothetical protein RHSIM_Rhsim07G0157400 [Rhododendron simsii]|uniref:non-specific serine/threonine protein kinase n=1 Tax=Rhododendron simsii TaxID=118357 RepID=A0A834GLR6_RHOSS|nr:hypothetical protein RHSIM_Rhsim07G0157400 [Rhododendron simsii]
MDAPRMRNEEPIRALIPQTRVLLQAGSSSWRLTPVSSEQIAEFRKIPRGEVEKEFKVEVEVLAALLSSVRVISIINFNMLVYEYVNNGNLEQWLQEAVHQYEYLTWEARIKVLLGTVNAFGLAKLLGAGNG